MDIYLIITSALFLFFTIIWSNKGYINVFLRFSFVILLMVGIYLLVSSPLIDVFLARFG